MKEHSRIAKENESEVRTLTPYVKLTPDNKYLKVRRDSMKVLKKT